MGQKRETQRNAFRVAAKFRSTLAGFFAVVGHSWDLDQKRNGTGLCSDKPHGNWDRTAEDMMLEFAEPAHPIFRASSALERGNSRSNEHGKKSTQFNDNKGNIEMLLRTVTSVNRGCKCACAVACFAPTQFQLECGGVRDDM